MNELTISTKHGRVVIQPTYEMGGGVDGYILSGKVADKEPVNKAFSIPHYNDPDKEWKVLSEYGKNKVRENGWDEFRTLEEILVYVFNYLNFTTADVELLTQQRKEEEETIITKTTYSCKNPQTYNPKILTPHYKNLRNIDLILNAWDKRNLIAENRKNFDSWIAPKE